MNDKPPFQFRGGPWEGRTLPADTPMPREFRVPVVRPITITAAVSLTASSDPETLIAIYRPYSVSRSDLYIFVGYE